MNKVMHNDIENKNFQRMYFLQTIRLMGTEISTGRPDKFFPKTSSQNKNELKLGIFRKRKLNSC